MRPKRCWQLTNAPLAVDQRSAGSRTERAFAGADTDNLGAPPGRTSQRWRQRRATTGTDVDRRLGHRSHPRV